MLADQIRDYVNRLFILPTRRSGEKSVSFSAKEIHEGMELVRRYPAVCGAIDADKFEKNYGVRLICREGPKQSNTVKWKFEV